MALYLDGRMVHASEGLVTDDDFLLLFNAYEESLEFVIPTSLDGAGPWRLALDTARPELESEHVDDSIAVAAFGLALLIRAT